MIFESGEKKKKNDELRERRKKRNQPEEQAGVDQSAQTMLMKSLQTLRPFQITLAVHVEKNILKRILHSLAPVNTADTRQSRDTNQNHVTNCD